MNDMPILKTIGIAGLVYSIMMMVLVVNIPVSLIDRKTLVCASLLALIPAVFAALASL